MQSIPALLRLIHNLLRFGAVTAVDPSRARVRVATGGAETQWLPWLEVRAGASRTWDPPTVGEQVIVLAPAGELATAVVLTGLYRDNHPAPVNGENLWHRIFPDGAQIQYDHQGQHLSAVLPGSASIIAQRDIEVSTSQGVKIRATGGVDIQGDVRIRGNTQVRGDFAARGGSFSHNGKNVGDDHAHKGVTSGPATTGNPV